jgi:hypothetical protein
MMFCRLVFYMTAPGLLVAGRAVTPARPKHHVERTLKLDRSQD